MLRQEYERNDDLLSGQILHFLPREGFTRGSNHQFRVLNTTQPAYFLNACIIDPSAQMLLQMKKVAS